MFLAVPVVSLYYEEQDDIDMNHKLKDISRDVLGGKQLQETLPQFLNHLANQYQTYAGVKLAMQYYSLYEAYTDSEDSWSRDAVEAMNRINEIIREGILKGCCGKEREKAIIAVDGIRRDISRRMNILTAYADIFLIYEYILNRIEYRFVGEPEEIDDEELSRAILRYIFDTQDNFVINEKIREMIGQLPIRITKQKYYDLLQESINAYLGAEVSSLNSYLYMLRTSAMLCHEEGMDTYYPKLWKQRKKLASTDYRNLTKQGYEKAFGVLQGATLVLETESTAYLSMMEIINEIYAMLLCNAYAGMVQNDNETAESTAMQIIRETSSLFSSEDSSEQSLGFLDWFEKLEGVQEEISDQLILQEDALYETEHVHGKLAESMMLQKQLQSLIRAQKLLSNSLFADLEEQPDEIIADEDKIAEESRALLEELRILFANSDMAVCRAVIANTINKIPVFFKNHKEVMDYVRYSIERCTNRYEKAACFDIINEIISE